MTTSELCRRLFTWMGSNFQSLRRTDATTCVAQREWVPCLSEKILIRRAPQYSDVCYMPISIDNFNIVLYGNFTRHYRNSLKLIHLGREKERINVNVMVIWA